MPYSDVAVPIDNSVALAEGIVLLENMEEEAILVAQRLSKD